MITRLAVLLYTLTLMACARNKPVDTVEALVANPDRLKEVMQQCHSNHSKMGDPECNAASEAFRRRFTGNVQLDSAPTP
jgi:hypothetical protein